MRMALLSRSWSSVPARASPANSAPLASANAPSVFDIEPMVSSPPLAIPDGPCPPSDRRETIRYRGRCDHRNPAVFSPAIPTEEHPMARAKSRLKSSPKSRAPSRVVGIDHISIRVSDYAKSKAFYGKLFELLGFEISDEN